MSKFEPSIYQKAIFDWIVKGRGDAVVQACAGSGKTTTLVEASKLLRSGSVTFLAFNKHIAKELQQRVGKTISCKTIHSVGMSCLRSHRKGIEVDESKYNDIAKSYAKEISDSLNARYQADLRSWGHSRGEKRKEPEEPPNAGIITGQLKKLVHFCMVTLTPVQDFDAVAAMVDHFGCLDPAFELKVIHYYLVSIIREGERIAANQGLVDYDEMLYLPHAWQLAPPQQDWVLVDEAQDLSPAQMDLVFKMRGKGGRLVFVGDKNQAIYGFAGASSDSIDQIISRSGAVVLPLSICYRCPVKHVELAQKIVASIEPAPDAIEGEVKFVSRETVLKEVSEGDLIISRCTAPAIQLCIELIARRIPAKVRGRDIGKSLTNIVKEVASHPDFDFDDFSKFLDEYLDVKVVKLEQRKNSESQVQSLRDRVEGIRVCYEAFNCNTADNLCREIESLFSDERSSVVLSTVHRAKGLEEKRVFILRPEQLPLRWPKQQDWELAQELNLKYIALTRAKESLFFIKDEDEACDNDDNDDDEF